MVDVFVDLSEQSVINYFGDTIERIALGGIMWFVLFAILSVLSFYVAFIMSALLSFFGVIVFLGVAIGFLINSILPYYHAIQEVQYYYSLIEKNVEVDELCCYPLSGFYHYMSFFSWSMLLVSVCLGWVSLIFVIIAFLESHDGTFLLSAAVFVVCFILSFVIILKSIAKKNEYLACCEL